MLFIWSLKTTNTVWCHFSSWKIITHKYISKYDILWCNITFLFLSLAMIKTSLWFWLLWLCHPRLNLVFLIIEWDWWDPLCSDFILLKGEYSAGPPLYWTDFCCKQIRFLCNVRNVSDVKKRFHQAQWLNHTHQLMKRDWKFG